MKTSYHPAIIVGYYLECLPEDFVAKIPGSTKFDWKKRQLQLFGYNWYLHNQDLFSVMKNVAVNKNLLKINRLLIKVIALSRFIKSNGTLLKTRYCGVQQIVLNHIAHLRSAWPLNKILKWMNISYSFYLRLKNSYWCHHSPLRLCPVSHPGQLLCEEIHSIKKYCSIQRFSHWPLSSVYHQIKRDKAGFFAMSTFYKYVSLLNLKRVQLNSRRKNHNTGIRAGQPLSLLHADVSVYLTADNLKAYIYLVQDNFSRAILSWKVENTCTARHSFENLQNVYNKYLLPSNIKNIDLLTDNGHENFGPVTGYLLKTSNPTISHIVAQTDIEFSNSMIEAVNKQIKYRFLYHKHIADINELRKCLNEAVEDYNNRPNNVLKGLTPYEVLKGSKPVSFKSEIIKAKSTRLTENKRIKCNCYSF